MEEVIEYLQEMTKRGDQKAKTLLEVIDTYENQQSSEDFYKNLYERNIESREIFEDRLNREIKFLKRELWIRNREERQEKTRVLNESKIARIRKELAIEIGTVHLWESDSDQDETYTLEQILELINTFSLSDYKTLKELKNSDLVKFANKFFVFRSRGELAKYKKITESIEKKSS